MREKLIVILAVVIVGTLSIYDLVIEPYHQDLVRVTEEIDQAKSDLLWMQSEVQSLPVNTATQKKVSFNGSLANLINQAVANQKLKTYLTQMTPIGESEIRIRYSSIDFNQLIAFISTLKERGLIIKDLRINSTSDIATVDSTVVFKKPA
jgi:type II secretory pathway component PulM|tara:strand:- start:79 stop:528 length:450 start_codon:yes stop_codon:yes gene_type:complete